MRNAPRQPGRQVDPATVQADAPPVRASTGWCLALFALSAALRGIHLATVTGSKYFTHLGLDPLFFDEWGRRIAGGEWLGGGVFYQDPLYPYFLGTLYSLFGSSHVAAVAVQLLLGSLVAPMVFAAAARWFGKREAAVAGLLAATYLPSIYYEAIVLKTWMDVFLAAAALLALSRALVSGRLREWVLTGFLFGLCVLSRGNLLLVVAALAAWVLVDRSALGESWTRRRAMTAALVLVLGSAVVLGATGARNRRVTGRWILTTVQGGQNFYIGNNAGARTGRYEPPPFLRTNPKYEEHDFAAEAERRTGRGLDPVATSSFWFREGLSWVTSHPGDWLALTWRKLMVYWSAYEVPDNLDYYAYRETAPVLRWPLPGFGLVVSLGLLGALLALRRPGWPRGVLVYAGAYSLSVILFFVIARYRMAMIPALFPFAGFGAVELARRARAAVRDRSRRPGAAGAMVLALAAFAFVNLPVRAPENHWAYRTASALGIPAVLESSSVAHFNIGVLLAKADDLAGAEEELREAMRQDSRHVEVHVELGKVLARQGRDREAIAEYRQGLEISPGRADIHHVIGVLCRRTGDLPAARDAFAQALRLDPRRADSAKALAEAEAELALRGK
jgi:4-amino-4-deoxy-L-arabinose transferase-like glycosyltransferase